jgi:hypothetical protein
MTPRRTTDLDPKGGRDSSMLLKRGVAEDVYAPALQRLRDRVRAGLPQSQSPGVEYAHSSVARLYADARESYRFDFRRWYALLTDRCPVRVFKGMNGGPTSRSIRSVVTEHGMAYSPRGPWSRSRGSSRGSHAPPGGTGEPWTGPSTTGGQRVRSHAVREMRRAKVALALKMVTGELTEIERLTVSSERGGWKSAHRGNSLAAYSTSRTVLRAAEGAVPLADSPIESLIRWLIRNDESDHKSAGRRVQHRIVTVIEFSLP